MTLSNYYIVKLGVPKSFNLIYFKLAGNIQTESVDVYEYQIKPVSKMETPCSSNSMEEFLCETTTHDLVEANDEQLNSYGGNTFINIISVFVLTLTLLNN